MTTNAPIPVIFIHGLWLHATSWNNRSELFTDRGYSSLVPGWPGDSATVQQCRDNAQAIANRSIGEVTDHFAKIIAGLDVAPVVIGHSFGGLIAERLLGMGLARGGVVIAAAQFKGVRRLPFVQLKTAWPVLGHPSNKTKAVSQTPDQFAHGFANGVPRSESDQLYQRFAIPAPALPLFEAGTANFTSKTDATVNGAGARGPLLLIAGGADRTVPEATVRSAFHRYKHNPSVTRFQVFQGRSHSQPIDHGWRDVAEASLTFLADHGMAPTAAASHH